MRRRKRPRAQAVVFECPHCGAVVRQGAAACRECGSDVRTGWQSQEEIDYQSLELPEGWGAGGPVRGGRARRPLVFVIAAFLVVLGLLLWAVLR